MNVCFKVWGVFKGTWPDWDVVWLVSLRCLFQSVNTDMPRPFRLFSTPATRDKGNSEIKSATTTTTGKAHDLTLLVHEKAEYTLLEKSQGETCVWLTLLWHLSGLHEIYTALLALLLLYFPKHFLFAFLTASGSVLLRLKAVYTFKYIMSDALCYIYAYIYML